MVYKKDFGVLCKAHGCRAALTEYDIYYSGRFCTNCLRLECIITRECNLLRGDYYKHCLKDITIQVTKVDNTTIYGARMYNENGTGGGEVLAGVHSKRLVYLYRRNQ